MAGSYTKDQKLVWAKSGGICSKCKIYCIEDAKNSSDHSLFGQVAHIAGEKSGATRFDASISVKQRNRFPNLLLLCASCHTIVDNDGTTYSVPVLEEMKKKHEEIVRETLSGMKNLSSEGKEIYQSLVSEIESTLQLKRWDSMSSCCLRYLLMEWFDDALIDVYRKIIQFSLPDDAPELNAKIKNLAAHAFAYAEHFRKNANYAENGVYTERKNVGFLSEGNYNKYMINRRRWEKANRALLDNLSLAIRDFAHAVRKFLDPHFHPDNRDFWLNDDMGVWVTGPNGEGTLEPKFLIPCEYHVLTDDDLLVEDFSFFQ